MSGTEDLFTPVHKGLRSMLYALSGRLQTHDFADLTATRVLVTDLENDYQVAQSAGCVLCALASHATAEEEVVFPPARSLGNGLVPSLIEEHHELTRREVEIAKGAHTLLDLPTPEDRVAAGIQLNQKANGLLTLYLSHMNREEVELVPLMRDRFTDAEQAAMQGAIIRGFSPDRLLALLHWMLPSLNVTELSKIIATLQHGAPPPLLKAVVDLCAKDVEPARWAAVRSRVGI